MEIAKSEVESEVYEIISDITGLSQKEAETDKGTDKFKRHIDDIIEACEEAFEIYLPYEDIFEIETPKDLIEVIYEKEIEEQ